MGPVREMLSAAGLTEQQWRILRVLEEGGAMDARALAEGAALLAPSLSRMLPALEDRGVVRRQGNAKDRRRQVIEITDKGRALIEANKAHTMELAASNRQRLGSERYDQLMELLGEISGWRDSR